jgi:rRNA maturation RNase YbeY
MNEQRSSGAEEPGTPDHEGPTHVRPPIRVEFEIITLDVALAGADEERLGAIVPYVLGAEGQSGKWEVALVLTDDRRLSDLHARFMGIDENTDVMTFPFDPAGPARGGEIVVSVERAAEQAAEHGQTAAGEVEFLLVHGLLHLCGWDDLMPSAREAMLARQSGLLAAFDRESGETRP